MTTLSKVREARKLFDAYRELESGAEMIWWEKAEVLYKLRFQKLYKFVFGTDEEEINKSFRSFCGEIDIPPTTANYITDTYKKWVMELGYSKSEMVDYIHRKLYRASLPKYNITKKDSDEVLRRCLPVNEGGLSFNDFNDYLEGSFT